MEFTGEEIWIVTVVEPGINFIDNLVFVNEPCAKRGFIGALTVRKKELFPNIDIEKLVNHPLEKVIREGDVVIDREEDGENGIIITYSNANQHKFVMYSLIPAVF